MDPTMDPTKEPTEEPTKTMTRRMRKAKGVKLPEVVDLDETKLRRSLKVTRKEKSGAVKSQGQVKDWGGDSSKSAQSGAELTTNKESKGDQQPVIESQAGLSTTEGLLPKSAADEPDKAKDDGVKRTVEAPGDSLTPMAGGPSSPTRADLARKRSWSQSLEAQAASGMEDDLDGDQYEADARPLKRKTPENSSKVLTEHDRAQSGLQQSGAGDAWDALEEPTPVGQDAEAKQSPEMRPGGKEAVEVPIDNMEPAEIEGGEPPKESSAPQTRPVVPDTRSPRRQFAGAMSSLEKCSPSELAELREGILGMEEDDDDSQRVKRLSLDDGGTLPKEEDLQRAALAAIEGVWNQLDHSDSTMRLIHDTKDVSEGYRHYLDVMKEPGGQTFDYEHAPPEEFKKRLNIFAGWIPFLVEQLKDDKIKCLGAPPFMDYCGDYDICCFSQEKHAH